MNARVGCCSITQDVCRYTFLRKVGVDAARMQRDRRRCGWQPRVRVVAAIPAAADTTAANTTGNGATTTTGNVAAAATAAIATGSRVDDDRQKL